MKPITIFLIILYLVLFSAFGVWFYFKYFQQVTNPNNKTQVINLNKDKTIFYTEGNNLYQLNSDNLNRNSSDVATYRLQSTGKVQTIKVDQKNEFFVYDCITSQNASEIWQVSFSDNHSEKIFSANTPGFEMYSNFRSPKMSKTGRQMAFVASNQGVDDIFVWDIEPNTTENLTSKSVKEKITAFDWSTTELKIYFSTLNNDKVSLKSIDLKKTTANLFEGTNKITNMNVLADKIIVMFLDSNEIANLGHINLKDPKIITPITDIKTPSTITSFDLSIGGSQVVYQTQDTLAKINDLYIMNIDGTNLLQLTTDGKSYYPIFSPDSGKIAFYIKDSGVYTMDTFKTAQTKILNDEGKIDNLILWR